MKIRYHGCDYQIISEFSSVYSLCIRGASQRLGSVLRPFADRQSSASVRFGSFGFGLGVALQISQHQEEHPRRGDEVQHGALPCVVLSSAMTNLVEHQQGLIKQAL